MAPSVSRNWQRTKSCQQRPPRALCSAPLRPAPPESGKLFPLAVLLLVVTVALQTIRPPLHQLVLVPPTEGFLNHVFALSTPLFLPCLVDIFQAKLLSRNRRKHHFLNMTTWSYYYYFFYFLMTFVERGGCKTTRARSNRSAAFSSQRQRRRHGYAAHPQEKREVPGDLSLEE